MARLIVIYDPKERLSGLDPKQRDSLGVKEASLTVADDLDGKTISTVARTLARLLLEQLR